MPQPTDMILALGVLGVVAGLIGLLLPALKRVSFSLPKLGFLRAREDEEAVESLIAELEKSGFRQSPFESRSFTSRLAARPALDRRPEPGEAEDEDDADELLPPPRRPDPTGAAQADEEPDDAGVSSVPLSPAAPAPRGLAPGARPADALEAAAAAGAAAGAAPGAPETPTAETPSFDAPALEDDIMALFGEATVVHAAPRIIRDALEDVTIDDLLAEARSVHRLLAGREADKRTAA